MAVSRFYVAQRWCGASIPVNMLRAGDLRLLRPLDTTAPQAAHMLHELRSLGSSITLGWRCEPHAELDETVYDAVLGLAGDDEDGAMTDTTTYTTFSGGSGGWGSCGPVNCYELTGGRCAPGLLLT